MEGVRGATEEQSGMIPKTVRQIYKTAEKLKNKNWTYEMEGQFLQIYNETIHDLLGNPSDFGKLKHEIKHEKNGSTIVTDMTTGRIYCIEDKLYGHHQRLRDLTNCLYSFVGLTSKGYKLVEEGKPESCRWSYQHKRTIIKKPQCFYPEAQW
jgi:hypothetical protein